MYKRLIAKRFIKVGKTSFDGRFFILVVGSDEKIYQIKFNLKNTKGNQKELITNYIGKEMGVSVPDGAFIKFSDRQMKNISSVLEFDNSDFKENIYFGIEWYEASINLKSEKHLDKVLKECKNKDEFYAIYPFDQFLRNYDRHYGNHLIVKKAGDKKPSHYIAIDGDRIFGSTNWDRLDYEKDKFECFKLDYHRNLYNLVYDREYTKVYRYLAQVTLVSITKLKELMDRFYNNSKQEHDKIVNVLEYRKQEIFNHCNGSCFPNVKRHNLAERLHYELQ